MRGLGFVTLEARFGAFQGVLRVSIYIILLLSNLGVAYLVSYMLLESIIRFSYLRWYVLKWFRKNNVAFENRNFFDSEIFRSLWSATWRTGLLFWGSYAINSGTSLLASQISDAVVMANFLFTMRIFTFVLNIARAPFYTHVPTIYKLAAEKDLPNLRRRSSEYMFLGFTVLILAVAVILFGGNFALDLIGTDTRFVALGILVIIAVTEILDIHASYHATLYTSTNHVPFVLPATISGALILAVGFYILPIYGLLGVVVAKFIIQFMFNNWYAPFLSLRLMKWPVMKYLYQFPMYGIQFIKHILVSNIPGLKKAVA